MKVLVDELREHPSYHLLMRAGNLLDGKVVEIDDSIAVRINPPLVGIGQAKDNSTPWPFWATLISKDKVDTDKGVGDTAARIIGTFGGDRFKETFKKLTGVDCGCVERQDLWNEKYRY